MNKNTFIYVLSAMLLLFTACDENSNTDEYKQGPPSFTSFSPASGPVGTLITVRGHNLQTIDKATIGGGEVVINNRISAKELVLRTTHEGSTGKIALSASEGQATSTDVFTYTYSTPIITTFPESYTVGIITVLKGSSLNSITEVKFGDLVAEIIESSDSELVIMVPDVRNSTVTVTYTYYDGTSYRTIDDTGATIIRQVPTVTSLDPIGAEVGTNITVTGSYLNLVDEVWIGDFKGSIINKTADGTTLVFRVVGDLSLPDGMNTAELKFYASAIDETVVIDNNFTFFIPKFYTWRSISLNSQSANENYQNHFLCLETGLVYGALDYAVEVDPVAYRYEGAVCSAKNTSAASPEEYYSVKPYIFMNYLGTGTYFYGPANNANRISNYKDASNTTSVIWSGNFYGTPIVQFRTLCEEIPVEKEIIDKIKGGTFSSDDFNYALLESIDFTSTGTSTPDGWSNQPNGEFAAFRDPAASNRNSLARPWAPELTTATQNGDFTPGTVILVVYYKHRTTALNASPAKNLVYKFGFLEINTFNQLSTSENGRRNGATFNVYWQRTPLD